MFPVPLTIEGFWLAVFTGITAYFLAKPPPTRAHGFVLRLAIGQPISIAIFAVICASWKEFTPIDLLPYGFLGSVLGLMSRYAREHYLH